MDPSLVVIAIEPDAAPLGFGLEHDRGIAHDQLGHLLGAKAGLREQRRNGGESDDGAQVGAWPALAAQAEQRLTPRKVQMRQMKVPHSTQGYPSDARSSRPQARQLIASFSLGW